MNRNYFQQLAELRLKEAKALLAAGSLRRRILSGRVCG